MQTQWHQPLRAIQCTPTSLKFTFMHAMHQCIEEVHVKVNNWKLHVENCNRDYMKLGKSMQAQPP